MQVGAPWLSPLYVRTAQDPRCLQGERARVRPADAVPICHQRVQSCLDTNYFECLEPIEEFNHEQN